MANNLTPKEEFLLNPVTEHNITDAAIASFETNLRHPLKVTVPLEPKQDLHGYDHPWPGGGGKNLFGLSRTLGEPNPNTIGGGTSVNRTFNTSEYILGFTRTGYYWPTYITEYLITSNSVSITRTSSNTDSYGIAFPFELTAEATYFLSGTITNGQIRAAYYGENGAYISGANLNPNERSFTVPANTIQTLIILCTDSGDATFTNLQLESGSTATAYEPYENICPIEGWTECEVDGANANLLPISMSWIKAHNTAGTWSGDNYLINGITFSCNVVGGSLNSVAVYGTKTSNAQNFLTLCNIGIKANIAYVLTGCASGGNSTTYRLQLRNDKPQYLIDYGNGVKGSFANDTNVAAEIRITNSIAGHTYTGETFYPMLRLATPEDTKSPYTSTYVIPTGKSLPISWKHAEGTYEFTPNQEGSGDPSPTNVRPITPGLTITRDDNTTLTVWGGSITFNDDGTSRVVSDTALCTLDGTENWNAYNASSLYGYRTAKKNDSVSAQDNIICNMFPPSNAVSIAGARLSSNNLYVYGAAGMLGIESNDPAAMKAKVLELYNATTPIIYSYKLVTPTIYLLSIAETQHAITALGDKVTTTVYGGNVVVNEDGSVDVACEYYIVDGKKIPWSWSPGKTGIGPYAIIESDVYVPYCSLGTGQGSTAALMEKCSHGIVKNPYETPGPGFWVYNKNIRFRASSEIDTLEKFNEWLSLQEKVQFYYPLKTPITYHLPNVGKLKAFLGTNNIWSDAGNVDVRYLTQNSETGAEYRGDRALELRRRAMMADAPTIHTTVGSEETGGMASFKSYIKAPVKKIEVPFYPKQDLHGYDHPWPGGGGKNLFDPSWEKFDMIGVYAGQKVLDGETPYTISIFDKGGTADLSGLYFGVTGTGIDSSSGVSWLIRGGTIDRTSVYIDYSTTSNTRPYISVYNANEESWNKILDRFDVQVELNSTATSYEPYENICPIEGHDGCEITGCRRNLLNTATPYRTITAASTSKIASQADLEVGLAAGQMLFYGLTVWQNALEFNSTNQIFAVFKDMPLGAYSSTYNKRTYGVFDNLSCEEITVTSNGETPAGYKFTVAKKYKYVLIYCHNYAQSSTQNPWTIDDVVSDMMVVKGNTVGEYEPYQATKVPLVFNQAGDHEFTPIQDGTGNPSPTNVRSIHPGLTFTRDDDSVLSVYGGTLTVNADGTGSLSSTKAPITFSSSTGLVSQGFGINTTRAAFPANYIPGIKLPPSAPYALYVSSDKFVARSYGADLPYTISQSAAGGVNFTFPKTEYPTFEDIVNYFDTNTVQLVYELATPTTYTLSVTETNRALEALGLTQHIGQIYGGTVTINPDGSADVVAEWAGKELDGVNNKVKMASTTYIGNITTRAYKGLFSTNAINPVNAISESTLYSTVGSDIQRFFIVPSNGETNIFILNSLTGITSEDTTASAATKMNAYLAENPFKFIYKLATPQTYHFSNLEQLKVWLGENNFWCDISDDITVKYWNRG